MHQYLLTKDPDDVRDYNFSGLAPTTILHDSDYTNQFPPIWDQGQLGSCQSHAIDAIDAYIKGYTFTPSHLFEYYNVRAIENTVDRDAGGNLRDTCAALAVNGVCDGAIWPYAVENFSVKPPQEAYDNAKFTHDSICKYYRVTDIRQIRQALSAGHTPLIGIKIYENFEQASTLRTGIIPGPKGQLLGGHALVIVGHHDTTPPSCKCKEFIRSIFIKRSAGTVKIRNSWGTGIGLNGSGYFSATYEVLERLLMDAWVIVS